MFQFFDASGSDALDKEAVVKHRKAAGDKKPIRCRSCNAIITDAGEQVAIAGQHVYLRSNPAGIEFEFGCFRKASGCTALGIATPEYSWFAGYRWQIAVCGQCKNHLGWFFSGADPFYGLILAQLRQDD